MARIAYIELVLDDESKKALCAVAKDAVKRQDYCFLKRKGGNVCKKAHLTLYFGLDYDKLNIGELEPVLRKIQKELKQLELSGLEEFQLGDAPCKVLVARVKESKELLRWHQFFKENFASVSAVARSKFKPHISLVYARKNSCSKLDLALPQSVKLQSARLKIFGARAR